MLGWCFNEWNLFFTEPWILLHNPSKYSFPHSFFFKWDTSKYVHIIINKIKTREMKRKRKTKIHMFNPTNIYIFHHQAQISSICTKLSNHICLKGKPFREDPLIKKLPLKYKCSKFPYTTVIIFFLYLNSPNPHSPIIKVWEHHCIQEY